MSWTDGSTTLTTGFRCWKYQGFRPELLRYLLTNLPRLELPEHWLICEALASEIFPIPVSFRYMLFVSAFHGMCGDTDIEYFTPWPEISLEGEP